MLSEINALVVLFLTKKLKFVAKTEAYMGTVEASIPPKANVCEQC